MQPDIPLQVQNQGNARPRLLIWFLTILQGPVLPGTKGTVSCHTGLEERNTVDRCQCRHQWNKVGLGERNTVFFLWREGDKLDADAAT